ncbi:carboxypeptidase-like regulatory domain-containing protein [candidate division KSB1 bacterium]
MSNRASNHLLTPGRGVSLLLAIMLSLGPGRLAAQEAGDPDRIVTLNGRVIVCHIDWVLADHIEYTDPSMPTGFSVIQRDSVNKVIYHDGRRLDFSLRLFLKDGDVFSGRLMDDEGDRLKLRTQYGLLDIPRASIDREETLNDLLMDLEEAIEIPDVVETAPVETAPMEAETLEVDTIVQPIAPMPMEIMETLSDTTTDEDQGQLVGHVFSFQDISSPNRQDPGATLVVYRDGSEVGRASADMDGAWSVSLPAGSYSVVCDFKRHQGRKEASEVVVAPGERTRVDFVFTYLDLNSEKYFGKGVWTIGESKNVATGEIEPLQMVP